MSSHADWAYDTRTVLTANVKKCYEAPHAFPNTCECALATSFLIGFFLKHLSFMTEINPLIEWNLLKMKHGISLLCHLNYRFFINLAKEYKQFYNLISKDYWLKIIFISCRKTLVNQYTDKRSRSQMFFKIGILKISQYSQENNCLGVSF